MSRFPADAVLRTDGWHADTRVGSWTGWAIPGMPNAHSHAFQRAMAGWAEHLDPSHPADSFWTWRDAMYRLANRIEPADLESIAAQLYAEMLEAGYTAVAEFHYLHHDRDGRPYADPAEMSRALLRAADTAGIRITLLPVFYAHGGFGRPLGHAQRRFGHTDVATFARLLESLQPEMSAPGRVLGLAAHSLRAVAPDELAALSRLAGPIHIHIAEQPAEVERCLAVRGRRPVTWLLEEAPVDGRWGLVHATHTNPAEVAGMVDSGATVVLCPTTEANLGDGLFDLPALLSAEGRLAIGSDSHVTVDPCAELRLLEYGQRLQRLSRNVAASPAQPSTGERLWRAAAAGGARSMGIPTGEDWILLDPEHPRLVGHSPQSALDAFVFSSGAGSPIRDVIVAGTRVVEEGVHVRRAPIAARFRRTMTSLLERI